MISHPDEPSVASLAPMVASDALDPTAGHTALRGFGPAWKLVPILTASGFASLGYEMVWTRAFSVVLGTEMMAVLGSIAGLFVGVALGAFVLDAPIRRARSPWMAYAALEIAIGIWGLVSVWFLPAVGRLVAPLLGTDPAPALLWASGFVVPVLVLLPATTAIGGTLTALERMLVAASGNDRLSAGAYGANTAGAVAGTLLTVFCLFPAFGLSGTLFCLAGLNLLCAVGALALGAKFGGTTTRSTEPRLPSVAPTRLAVTLFATGLLGVAVEVLVVRLAAQTLQNTIYTFASLLAAYLLGTASGGLVWHSVRSGGHSRLSALLGVTSILCLATAALIPFMSAIAERGAAAGVAGELAVAVALFLVPSIAMGALFGFLGQEVRDQRGSLGWAVGINSVGAAVAPLLTTQMLIPTFGAWRALILTAIGYLALLPLRRTALIWLLAPTLLALAVGVLPAPSLIRVPPGGHLLAQREGPMVTASVVDDLSGARYLEVNGHFRMGGTNSVRSDYRQAILPLLLHPAPRRALLLGVGTGATLAGGSTFPGLAVRGVELSPEVVHLLPWFADAGARSPAPLVTVADARRYVVADRGQYDVIIADLFHPALDGSGSLYTTEHFRAVRQRLAPGGIFCQWLPLYQLDLPSLQAIIRTFVDVYPGASAWLNHLSVRMPMLALVGSRDAGDLDADALETRLRESSVAEVTRPIGLEGAMDVLGLFLGGAHGLTDLAGDGPRNTDDYPFVALDASHNVRALQAPPAALLLTVIHKLQSHPTDLLAFPQQETLQRRLKNYWLARNRFLDAGAALRGDPRGAALIAAAAPGLLEAIRLSPEFEPAYRPLLQMARSLLASDRQSAARLLHAIDEAAPSRDDARKLLVSEFGG